MLSSVRRNRGRPAGHIVTAVFDEVNRFAEGVPIDDMTAVVLKVSQA
jgi:hypothetical protein